MKHFLAFFVLVISAFSGLGAQTNTCDDVLRLTGREYKIEMSEDMGEEYLSSATSSSRSRSIAYKGIEANGNDTDSFSSTEYNRWEKTYFSAIDSIFEPAVEAWLACTNSRAVDMRFVELNGRELIVDFYAGQGTRPSIIEVRASGAICRLGGRSVAEISTVNLRSTATSLVCERAGNTTAPIRILVRTSERTIPLTILRHYLEPDTSQVVAMSPSAISGCGATMRLPSTNYHREIRIRDIAFRQNGSSGAGGIAINGEIIAQFSGSRPPGQGSYVVRHLGGGLKIPANVPIFIRSSAGSNSGTCQSLTAKLFVTKDPGA
jgi:hypothetical protein